MIGAFPSIWNVRAVFRSGMLVIWFEGVRDLGALEEVGNGFLSIWNHGVLFRKTYAVALGLFKCPLSMDMDKAIVAETSF